MNDLDIFHALAEEQKLEIMYCDIGLALDINRLMPEGVTFNRFTLKYSKFAEHNPTPAMLAHAQIHTAAFIADAGYEDEAMQLGATVWVLSRIWAVKRDKPSVFTEGLRQKLADAQLAREQKVELHKAVSRLAKNAAADSFAAGLKVQVTNVLNAAAARQLADLTRPVETDVGEPE